MVAALLLPLLLLAARPLRRPLDANPNPNPSLSSIPNPNANPTALWMAPRGYDDAAAGSSEDFEMEVDIQDLLRYGANLKAVRTALGKQGVEGPAGQFVVLAEESSEWLYLQAAYDAGVRSFGVRSGAALRELNGGLPDDIDIQLLAKFNPKLVARLKRMPRVSAVRVATPDHTAELCGILQAESARKSSEKLKRVSKSRAGFLQRNDKKGAPKAATVGAGLGVLLDRAPGTVEGEGEGEGDDLKAIVAEHAGILGEKGAGGAVTGIFLGPAGDKGAPKAAKQALKALGDEGYVVFSLSLPGDDYSRVFSDLRKGGVPLERVTYQLPLADLTKRLD
eukprot:CAMPEP_0118878254 /NCGR_PEP_ID=MMETSP1163-20130328/18232_1 /TAXON_ID=124430 /ORGANISM="Phaeomonas parva, Strain CCMP2877" /LENGTH=335 /DNA_ID=CAMNT_0006814061 /DNA_START=19 /DNA_END=1026 /DNA_ORIENTATION=+